MTPYHIKTFPEPILRVKACELKSIGDDVREVLARMAETMYLAKGVGLAATQVGIDKQLAVLDVGSGLIKMVNPVIVRSHDCEIDQEGCLSVPKTVIKVKRSKDVSVQFLDENGSVCQLKASGLLARALQHEIDHLTGKLIIDYLSPVERLAFKAKNLIKF